MLGNHFLFESVAVEQPRLAVLFAFDQLITNRFVFRTSGLVAPDQVADIFTVIGKVATLDLRLIHASCWSVTVMVLRVVPIVSPEIRVNTSHFLINMELFSWPRRVGTTDVLHQICRDARRDPILRISGAGLIST